MQRFFAVLCLGTIAIAAGCTPAPDDTAPPVDSAQPPVANPVFDPAQVQPGDRVLDLEVTRVDVSQLEPGNRYVGTVTFEGEVTVSGTYVGYTPPGMEETGESLPCFKVDESSADQLPRFPEDERNAWFCFDNPEVVQQTLGEPADQPVTIVIDNFEYAYIPSDVTNQAIFIRVAN